MLHFARLATLALMVAFLTLSARAEPFAPFNARIGTQTFSPKYHFTPGHTRLVETAERIHAMGSDVVKFGMAADAATQYGLPPLSGIGSLTQMARDEPSFRHVFDMPFRYFQVWAYPLSIPGSHFHGYWRNGLSQANANKEYAEVYAFARYLLQAYNGSGKTFMLGHWEGDWALLGSFNADSDPGTTAINGMIAWYNVRQQALQDARRDEPHANVWVAQYSEVNLVLKAMLGRPTVTNSVLPHVSLDLVSYSAYDALGSMSALTGALSYLESKASTTDYLPFARKVFIGEYGFPLDGHRSPIQQAILSRAVMRAAGQWGCPFILYWQMYDNEADEGGGNARGFWLIDNQNQQQPVYGDHQRYLGRIHVFKNMYRFWLGRNPESSAVHNLMGSLDDFRPSTQLRIVLESGEYLGLVSHAQFLELLFQALLARPGADHADYPALLARLNGGESRYDVLLSMLDGPTFANAAGNEAFAMMLTRGAWRREASTVHDAETQALIARLAGGESRSAVWTSCLDDERFLLAELEIRHVDTPGDATIHAKYLFDRRLATIGTGTLETR